MKHRMIFSGARARHSKQEHRPVGSEVLTGIIRMVGVFRAIAIEYRTAFAAEETYRQLRISIGTDQRASAQLKAEWTSVGMWFWRTASGPVSGLPAVREFKRGDARLVALEALWREKGRPERERAPAVRDTAAKLAKLIEQHEAMGYRPR